MAPGERTQIRKRLSPSQVALWDEVEASAGALIKIEPLPPEAPPGTDAGARAPPNSPAILVNNPNCVRIPSIVHELLHLRRYWVERIPQLVGIGRLGPFASRLENLLEHVVIVPTQACFDAAEPDHWAEASMVVWSKYPWPEETPNGQRLFALREWLAMSFVSDSVTIRTGRKVLKTMQLLDEAVQFRRSALRLKHDKPRFAKLVLQRLGHDIQNFQIVEYDKATGSQIITPL